MVPVVSNLGRGQHRHLTLMMIAEEYMKQTDYAILPLHNPGNYTPTMVTAQEKWLRTKMFQQN